MEVTVKIDEKKIKHHITESLFDLDIFDETVTKTMESDEAQEIIKQYILSVLGDESFFRAAIYDRLKQYIEDDYSVPDSVEEEVDRFVRETITHRLGIH